MYTIKGTSKSRNNAAINIKAHAFSFGITPELNAELASPAELFLGSFAACILKNVERFSIMMKFDYETATVDVSAVRLEKPPRMDEITYALKIVSNDPRLNLELLQRNIEKFGTIFNTVKLSCKIEGTIQKIEVQL